MVSFLSALSLSETPRRSSKTQKLSIIGLPFVGTAYDPERFKDWLLYLFVRSAWPMPRYPCSRHRRQTERCCCRFSRHSPSGSRSTCWEDKLTVSFFLLLLIVVNDFSHTHTHTHTRYFTLGLFRRARTLELTQDSRVRSILSVSEQAFSKLI